MKDDDVMYVSWDKESLVQRVRRFVGETQGNLEYHWNMFKHWLEYDAWWL